MQKYPKICMFTVFLLLLSKTFSLQVKFFQTYNGILTSPLTIVCSEEIYYTISILINSINEEELHDIYQILFIPFKESYGVYILIYITRYRAIINKSITKNQSVQRIHYIKHVNYTAVDSASTLHDGSY